MKRTTFFLFFAVFSPVVKAQVPAYVPTNGLVAFYPFTGNANDAGGNGINGTVSGASLTTDRFGGANKAYSFNGTTDYIELPYNALFDNANYSFSFWVKTTVSTSVSGGPGINQGVITRAATGGPGLTVGSSNPWAIYEIGGYLALNAAGCAGGIPTGGASAQTVTTVSDNAWHHVVYTASSGTCKCYRDGVLMNTNAYATEIAYLSYVTRIGTSLNTYWKAFQGSLDELAIYNRVLTPCEVSQLFTGTAAPPLITGSATVCSGNTIALTDATSGGVWSSSNTSLATVGSTGTVNGVTAGYAFISYTISGACPAVKVVTVGQVNISTVAGNGTRGYGGDAIPATNTMISHASGVAVDNSGNLYIADYGNSMLRKVNTSGIINIVAGDGSPGYSGDGFFSVASKLNFPTGVAVDATGNIYLADNGNNCVRKINTGGIITTIAGNGTPGYLGDGTAATAGELNHPESVAVDGSGNVYIADAGNNAIRLVNTAGIISTVAGTGTPGYSGDGSAATGAKINQPQGVALDGIGNLLIADEANNCIRMVNLSGIISTVVGNGTPGFLGDGSPATAAELSSPWGVTFDVNGNMYISDLVNNRIRKVNASGIISTVAGNGTPGYTSDGIAATSTTLNGPEGIAVDGNGNIFIADVNNDRIREVSPANPSVAAIAGPTSVCQSTVITLSDATTTGVWSSSNTAIATVGTAGNVSGLAGGTATITYTVGYACGNIFATQTVTVIPSLSVPVSITGTFVVCAGGATTALTDATVGGTWSSTNTLVATAGSTGIISGVSAGTSTISYTVSNSCGSNAVMQTVTVNPLPILPAVITGTKTVCAGGATTALSDITGGGVWSSTNTTNATVSGVGLVTGLVAGTSTISYTYTNSCGSLAASTTVTVNPLPISPAVITGTKVVCAGGSTTQLSNISASGVWSSTNTTVATISGGGLVTGLVAGTTTISYTYTNTCGSLAATTTVTVNPLPIMPVAITGVIFVCAGGATTQLSDITGGGTWTSTNTTNATVDAAGLVTGLVAGTTTISYTYTNSCGSLAATTALTVNPLPIMPLVITGVPVVCAGGALTLLSDVTAGGVWSSTNTVVATVAPGGVVRGLVAGTTTISYTYTNLCGSLAATVVVTVNPLPIMPAAIIGTPTLCEGGGLTALSDITPGCVWSSTNTAAATIDGTGMVTGVVTGTSTISYTYTNSCGSLAATLVVSVNPLPIPPVPITGTTIVCAGGAITMLTDATPGGAWTSSNTTVATVGGTGTVMGLAAGTSTISYTYLNSCGSLSVTAAVTVNPLPILPVAITGSTGLCDGGATSLLSDLTAGGTWTSTSPLVASIGTTGMVTGLTNGTSTISYTYTNSCGSLAATTVVTVNPFPSAGSISGIILICKLTTTLTDAAPGGIWISGTPGVATVSGTGLVTGVSTGTSIISYSVTNSCSTDIATATVTVNHIPVVDTVILSGSAILCPLSTVQLSDATPGGVWISGGTAVATVSAGGLVTGLGPDTATIYYAVTNVCGTTASKKLFKVLTVPVAAPITGPSVVCVGSTVTLSDKTGSGTWRSENTNAIITSAGVARGIVMGTDTIVYAVANICGSDSAMLPLTIDQCGVTSEAPFTNAAIEVKVLPNPSKGEFVVSGYIGTDKDEAVVVEVTDLLGQTVYRNNAIAVKGSLSEQVRLGNTVAGGTYILSLVSGSVHSVFHIVVEH